MITLIIYDITQTNNRNQIIKILQHYGLKRIQKSVFVGYLNKTQRQTISQELKKHIQTPNDSIILTTLCNTCKEKIMLHGNIKLPPEDEDYKIV